MTYHVNLRKLSAGFYNYFGMIDSYENKEIANYMFYRLANENTSFRDMVYAFNKMEHSYIMQKDETSAFMLALVEVLELTELDELDGTDDVYEIESWRTNKF